MSVRFPVFAITHVHTEASNGKASEMDGMIQGALREVLGQDTPARWSECFTRVERLVRLLGKKHHQPPVGIITVTDHMNARSHTLPDNLLWWAAREPRLAACAEITTVERDADGSFKRAPEVLLYGRPEGVPGPHGMHHGVSQEIIDDIFTNCRAPKTAEVRTSLVMKRCAALGLAHALAHPFDGHSLSLETTLDIISRGRFIETVNGGFPAVSTRILEDLVSFQNRVVSGWRMSDQMAARYPLAKRLEDKIVSQGRSMLHPWGGSDAHSHNFARVVMRFRAHRPDPTPGDLFGAMLQKSVSDHLVDGTFSVLGRPGSALSVVDDVTRIVFRNFWFNRPYVLDRPDHLARVVAKTYRVTRGELERRNRRQERLIAEVSREFNANQILQSLVPPYRLDLRAARRRTGSSRPRLTVFTSPA